MTSISDDGPVGHPRTDPAPIGDGLVGYRREGTDDPPLASPDYGSTTRRAPDRPLVIMPHTLTEVTGPAFGTDHVTGADADLTRQHRGEPLGERIIVHGRVLDGDGRPVPETLVEVWQANAAGRYAHRGDRHDAPLDENFTGAGRCLTDRDGRYRFTTIRPGAYPWRNHHNAWRPAHIHFSVFGRAFVQRLITQMYFPGDPLFGQDPIYNAVRDERARRAMVSAFDLEQTAPEWALAFRFDIVLRGRDAVVFEDDGDRP
jgi:protocatechuate 3,4-dioxygenase beta subunit